MDVGDAWSLQGQGTNTLLVLAMQCLAQSFIMQKGMEII